MAHRKTFSLVFALLLLIPIYTIELMFLRTPHSNVSAVETTENIGVYWDGDCKNRVYAIDWGNLSLGESKQIVVYVRNEGNESFILTLTPANWTPAYSPVYLIFSWSCRHRRIGIGEAVKVTQSLFVSPDTTGITNFSFDLIFEGRQFYLGDINRDGVVNMTDVVLVCSAFGATPKNPRWNPNADVNNNGMIDMGDVVSVIQDFGQS